METLLTNYDGNTFQLEEDNYSIERTGDGVYVIQRSDPTNSFAIAQGIVGFDQVSSRHAEIAVLSNKICVIDDNQSRNGTFFREGYKSLQERILRPTQEERITVKELTSPGNYIFTLANFTDFMLTLKE